MSGQLAQLLPADYVAALLRMDPSGFEMEFPRAARCECHACIKDHDLREHGLPLSVTRMILCPVCGNKRCPKAQDHRHKCTGSNEPGQVAELEGGP